MNKKYKIVLLILLPLLVPTLLGTLAWLHGGHVAVLEPRGIIAGKEHNLMVFATLLSLIVVVPVFVMTGVIVWKYRETNKKASYSPNFTHSRILEAVWWLVPLALITILSVITWRSSHDLDPYKPISSNVKPITIQVVALDWKWLFIYPEQHIATVNYVQFPERTPLNFEITADAPMNSFWIPQLGGQIYAMSGMTTQLHLMANTPGDFTGSSANISGRGFAGMHFVAKATSQADFDNWVASAQRAPDRLTLEQYAKLAQSSENNPAAVYSHAVEGLYDTVELKYMVPTDTTPDIRRVRIPSPEAL